MKRVFLYAYDRINLGDDLFIYTITNRYPNVKFYLWSDKNNRNTFKSIKNLVVLDKESLFLRILQSIRRSFVPKYMRWRKQTCDAIVYIGGSIFIEYDNWEQILNWWDYEVKNWPFYVLGANFGPYKTEDYRNKLAEVFYNVKDVCFRDQYSLNVFSDVPTVRSAPDILFGYPMPISDITQKQIFISVIDCGSRKTGLDCLAQFEKQYLDFLCRLLNGYLQTGYTLAFASFCGNEGDMIAIDNVLSVMNIAKENAKVKIIQYDGTNVGMVLQTISESELVVASRFHASILGFAANKPVLPVVYSDKTIHVLNDVGFGGIYLDIRALKDVDILYLQENLEQQKLHNVEILKEQSKKHFAKLDEVLC